MPTLFVKHRVRNYDSWRPAYDGHAGKRGEAGLKTRMKEAGVVSDPKFWFAE